MSYTLAGSQPYALALLDGHIHIWSFDKGHFLIYQTHKHTCTHTYMHTHMHTCTHTWDSHIKTDRNIFLVAEILTKMIQDMVEILTDKMSFVRIPWGITQICVLLGYTGKQKYPILWTVQYIEGSVSLEKHDILCNDAVFSRTERPTVILHDIFSFETFINLFTQRRCFL